MMKLICITLLTASCALITACGSSSKQPDSFTFVNRAATQCTTQLQIENQYVTGKKTLAPIFYVNRQFTQTVENKGAEFHVRAIPYFEASALDKGSPGSAWRTCMARRDAKMASASVS
ncbi:hypothetical protein J2125_004575 [Erwinia toletana]|uniref:Lipoprotein n=1 Tax=Winslowiella toletana TaxID=92490 RepID=A0ABS4PFF9_9GAMM|nr:hypothetical protein [Winslowiella toletana]MBP2171383.1 hypothetical protein [Winslowiella toletana]